MVLKASLESEKILVGGCDVAIADKGRLGIEENRRSRIDVVQVAGRHCRMNILNHVLNELN